MSTHYKIVRDDTIDGLADKVNSNISAGFICQGGVGVIHSSLLNSLTVKFIQAMVYKDNT